MSEFPQLTTGALVQAPLKKTLRWRDAGIELAGGAAFRRFDGASRRIEWTLPYRGLSQSEVRRLVEFFEERRGALREFTFADPLGNLLCESEDLAAAAWVRDAELQVVADQGAWQLTNAAQGMQRLRQTVPNAPAYEYCFSVWMKSDAAGVAIIAAGGARKACETRPEWKRCVVQAVDETSEPPLTAGVELPAGARVWVASPQLEAQRWPSEYKPTGRSRSLYPHTRFDGDEIAVSADGPGRFSALVKLVSRMEEEW